MSPNQTMKEKRLSNVAGFDDAPFDRGHQGGVPIVGAVYADLRFDGVLVGEIEKDGSDAAQKLGDLIAGSRFAEHIQFVMLQGIAFGGFNVVDVFALHRRLGMPVLVVSRKQPDMEAIKNALLTRVDKGAEKWQIITQLGAMEPVGNVCIQRVGLTLEQAAAAVKRFTIHGNIPEPLRTAHLIATAIECGQSRGHP